MTSTQPSSTRSQQPEDRTGAQLLNDLRQWAHEQRFALWVTAGFIIINICWWLLFAVQHKALPYAELSTTLGAFNLAHLMPSLILTRSVFQLVVEAILILFVLCVAEPVMGALRTTAVGLISAILGIGGGLLVCALLNTAMHSLPVIFHIPFTLSPVTLVIGALMASTAFRGRMWRRRIRIIGYAAILVVILYGGNPGDYCTLIAAVIGQFIGVAIAGRPHESAQAHWEANSSTEVRTMLGAIGFVLALGPVVASTSRSHAGPLTALAWIMSPLSVDSNKLATCMQGGVSQEGCFTQYALMRGMLPGESMRSLLYVLVMVVLAWGVLRGRRAAAIFSIAFYTLTAIITVVYYLVIPFSFETIDPSFAGRIIELCIVNSIVPLAYAIMLLVELRHFSIHTDPRRVRLSVTVILITLLATIAIYLVFGLTHLGDFTPHATASLIIAELPARFLPAGFLSHVPLMFMPNTPIASIIYQGVGIVFWAMLLVVAVLLLRASTTHDRHVQSIAEELVERGGESMSFMTTWEGNDYWLSPTHRSAVAYRVLNDIALTTTGPFGDPEEWIDDLDEFAKFCADNSWSPAFYAIHENQRDYLQAQGWHSIMVGEEMLIDPQSWKTTGKKWQDVRTAINKAKREGISDEMSTYDDAPRSVQEQIQEISDQWSQDKALPEMKFTLGGVEELKDPRVQVLYAIDQDGVVQAATSWLPTWRDGRVIGWTLDFMRYRKGSYNGIMEYLIARMAQRMHDWGVEHPDEQIEFVSLSAAPLAGLDNYTEATSDDTSNISGTTMLQHALAMVADWMEPAYGFKSLYRFKLKFQPIQRPVFISYRDSALLANLGIAVIRAYLPTLTFRDALGMLSSFRPATNTSDDKKNTDTKPDTAKKAPLAGPAQSTEKTNQSPQNGKDAKQSS